jgi:ankyrin repeat protein
LDKKVRVDLQDIDGRTPFLNLYSNKYVKLSKEFLNLGANVNQIDKAGLYALKYAMIRRDQDEINCLVKDYGANINQIDGKGRNLLHHAVNLSSATADASFEIERLLLALGIEINAKDHHQRTPLHYAFVKIGKW